MRAERFGVVGTVRNRVNDNSISSSSRNRGGFRGTVTWDDIVVSGPGTSTSIAARTLIDGLVEIVSSESASGLAQVSATLSLRATPVGGGERSSIGRLGSAGSNIVSTTAFDTLVETDPFTIDTRFPVTVELESSLSRVGSRASSPATTSRPASPTLAATLGGRSGDPVFVVDDGYTVTSLSAGVVDNQFVDVDALTLESFDTTGTQGIVTSNGDGTFTYDPAGAFDGLAQGETATDAFTYTVRDVFGNTDTATVTITIEGVSPPPVAVDDSIVVTVGSVVTVGAGDGLLANDSHPEGRPLSVASVDDAGLDGTIDGQFGWFVHLRRDSPVPSGRRASPMW